MFKQKIKFIFENIIFLKDYFLLKYIFHDKKPMDANYRSL